MSDRRSEPSAGLRVTALGLALGMALLASSGAAARDRLPDPTRPPTGIGPVVAADAVADPQAPFDLTAIFFAAERRIAIIDGQRLQEGSSIGAARILEIAPDRVRLLRAGEEIALELVAHDVKRAPASAADATTTIAPHAALPAAPADPDDGTANTDDTDDGAEGGR